MASKTPTSPQLELLFQVAPVSEEPVAVTLPRRSRARRTWLVYQLVAEARELVEAEFGDVWVEGEISNFRPASSGHLYFTLKDAEAQLPVVLFRRQALLLRFRPEDGLHVRVRGKASIYEQRGQLQLVAETMETVGAGSLQLAFEQLRDKLKAEGLFEQGRKRVLPAFPRTVAIVTSPTGAVIRDFLNIVGRRHSGLNVVIIPVAVQGDNAPAEIVAGIAQANAYSPTDIAVLARGGGSLEDLAAFNSEIVARAIAASRMPVVSAIGHETDFTIADFVADLRAPTPSAAAELITEAQHKVEELVEGLSNRLIRAARFQLLQSRQRLVRVPVAYAEQRVVTAMHRLEQRLDDLAFRMESAILGTLRRRQATVAEWNATVLRHDPRQQLNSTRESLVAARHSCLSLERRLDRAVQVSLAGRRSAWANVTSRLHALSPLAVMQRGYALVLDESGAVIRSVGQLSLNQPVSTRLSDGGFSSQVLAIQPVKTSKKKEG